MKILVKAVAGSHLFGTNTETSDKDFKGVYLPSSDEILLGSYQDTIRHSTGDNTTRNTKDDTDIELYSLRKFFAMLENGDTAALELLFTPEDKILEKDPLWDEIVSKRQLFLSKKVSALIGYIRQQSNKYGLKGSRMGELNVVLKKLKEIEKEHNFQGAKLKHSWEKIVNELTGLSHVHIIELKINNKVEETVPAIEILGAKFSHDTPFAVCIKSLSDKYKAYGQRAREAANNLGVDYKAISHCLRCAFQGIELMQTGYITLPHPQDKRDLLIKVKKGEIPYKELEPVIEKALEDLEKASLESGLKDNISRKLLDELLIDYHRDVIENENKDLYYRATSKLGW